MAIDREFARVIRVLYPVVLKRLGEGSLDRSYKCSYSGPRRGIGDARYNGDLRAYGLTGSRNVRRYVGLLASVSRRR